MSLKAKLEALIYAAEEPITQDQLAALLKEDLLALKAAQTAAMPEAPEASANPENASDPTAKRAQQKSERAELRALLKPFLEELVADYAREDRGIEVRQVAGGYRISTKPEHHDVVRAFAKLVTTAGRKAVIGRPMLYRTSKDFLLRFGLNDLSELPSLEEFEKLAGGELLEVLAVPTEDAVAGSSGVPGESAGESLPGDQAGSAETVTDAGAPDLPHDRNGEPAVHRIAPERNGD